MKRVVIFVLGICVGIAAHECRWRVLAKEAQKEACRALDVAMVSQRNFQAIAAEAKKSIGLVEQAQLNLSGASLDLAKMRLDLSLEKAKASALKRALEALGATVTIEGTRIEISLGDVSEPAVTVTNTVTATGRLL